MNTLIPDLVALVNSHLDVVQDSILNPTKETMDLNPSTNFKVWLHIFYKASNPEYAFKILYENKDYNTLQFISNYGNAFASARCREYLDFIQIEKGSFELPEKLYNRPQSRKIAEQACKDRNLDAIKKLYRGQYFEYGEVVSAIFEYGYQFRWSEVIEFMRSIYGDTCDGFEIVGIIKSRLKDGLVVEHYKQSEASMRRHIISSCLKYSNYDIFMDYKGDTLLSKCLNCWAEIEKMDFRIKIDKHQLFLYSLTNGDDKFSLALLEYINPKKNIVFDLIRYGASDTIISAVLQKWPDKAKTLDFRLFINFNPAPNRELSSAFTCQSIRNIEMHRCGLNANESQILRSSFLSLGRYDLVSSI